MLCIEFLSLDYAIGTLEDILIESAPPPPSGFLLQSTVMRFAGTQVMSRRITMLSLAVLEYDGATILYSSIP